MTEVTVDMLQMLIERLGVIEDSVSELVRDNRAKARLAHRDTVDEMGRAHRRRELSDWLLLVPDSLPSLYFGPLSDDQLEYLRQAGFSAKCVMSAPATRRWLIQKSGDDRP